MTQQEAVNESFNRKWKLGTCGQGEICWCRTITCDPPLHIETDEKKEYFVSPGGYMDTRLAEYIVELHNEKIKCKTRN
jgi:hypothetical protein